MLLQMKVLAGHFLQIWNLYKERSTSKDNNMPTVI